MAKIAKNIADGAMAFLKGLNIKYYQFLYYYCCVASI
ncbi:MAG: hypothetical protein CM15mP102_09030 [Flavobacteriales bacterium]|nr:MAG: hypothetical protein CM15mP102_09030 [Flavobacteriales bacterium]